MIGILPSGSDIVCIDADQELASPLRQGAIYKVRGYTRSSRPGAFAVLLEGIHAHAGAKEIGFDCYRFRPLRLPPEIDDCPDDDLG